MNPIEFTISNMATIAANLTKEKRQETFTQYVGKVVLFDKTDNFLAQYPLEDEKKWTKQEKNLLAFALANNPHAQDIVDMYNANVTKGGELKNKSDLFKSLNTISELMKANPYNELSFQSSVYKNILDSGFSEDRENIRLIKKSFNHYVDRPTIEDLIGQDSSKKAAALSLVQGIESSDKVANMNCTLGTSIAALASFGLISSLNPVSEIMPKIIEPIAQHLGTNPLILGAAVLGVTGFAFYKTFKAVNKAVKEVIDLKRENLISYADPQTMDNDSSKGFLNIKLIKNQMTRENFDVSNFDNKKFLALSAFANEKLFYPNIEVSKQMQEDFKLSGATIKKLNNLDKDQIHALSHVSDPAIRVTLLSEKTTPEQSMVLKNLSVMCDIVQTTNKDGIYFKSVDTINNIPESLSKKIANLESVEKQIVTSFLHLQKQSNNSCPPGLIQRIEANINSGLSVTQTIAKEIEVEYKNNKVEAPGNAELEYLKRLGKWATFQERMTTVNSAMKSELEDISQKYGFEKTDSFKLKYTVMGNIKQSGEAVLSRIQKMRDGVESIANKTAFKIN